MIEYLMPVIIVGIISLVIVFIVIFAITGKHKNFIINANQITNGMTENDVLDTLGEQPTSRENDGNKTILIWEKSQWKGIQNGGTLVRSLKVVLQNGKVVSVSSKNLDKSTFW